MHCSRAAHPRAGGFDRAVAHDDDVVGALGRLIAVRDHDGRAVLHEPVHRLGNERGARGAEVARRLVEQEVVCAAQHGARNAKPFQMKMMRFGLCQTRDKCSTILTPSLRNFNSRGPPSGRRFLRISIKILQKPYFSGHFPAAHEKSKASRIREALLGLSPPAASRRRSFRFVFMCRSYFFGLCAHALPHCVQLPVQFPPQQPPFFIVRRQTRHAITTHTATIASRI